MFSYGTFPPDAPAWQRQGYQHIWMPYTQMHTAPLPIPVVGTEGCRLRLADGSELIDGTASWWSAIHGYNHPHLIQALQQQAAIMPHVMFAGINHEQALTLASRLIKRAPEGLERVFFSDSGSVAVEVALKMAIQYWRNKGDKHRTRFLAFRRGYHGDTMGAMSVSDPDDGLHAAYTSYMPMQYIVDIPTDEYAFAEFDALLAGVGKNIAGVIIEPLVQCAGGFHFHSPDVLAELYRISKKHGILFIADEIATGFGRTGYFFACQEAGITPDLMCIGKGLTGGVITLAVTLATGEVFEAFQDEKLEKALMHGPTFTANPLACAAANASLDLFEQEPRMEQIETLEQLLTQGLEPCRELPVVRDVRTKGAMGIVEYDNTAIDMWELRRRFLEHGVWLRPFGGAAYIMPSYTMQEQDVATLCDAMHSVFRAL